jgi:hypothetical protein
MVIEDVQRDSKEDGDDHEDGEENDGEEIELNEE